MHQYTLNSTDLCLAIAGPVVVGALLGLGGVQGALHTSAQDVVHTSVILPMILLCVTAAMIPALYIATSLSGAAPPAGDVALAVMRGFRSCGIAMLGLAAPIAFLLSTTQEPNAAALVGIAVTSVGVFAGLRVLFSDLFAQSARSLSLRVTFAAWSLVALAIGARMYEQFMVG